MARDVEQILEKLEALKRRHQNLAGRQACAEAAGALQDADGGMRQDVDELFARWETEVTARELHTHASPVAGDSLAEEFEAAERQSDLRSSLADLLATPGSKQK
jgi:phage shock protein A